jgi:TPR repeat protein
MGIIALGRYIRQSLGEHLIRDDLNRRARYTLYAVIIAISTLAAIGIKVATNEKPLTRAERFQQLKASAESGDSSAQFDVGWRYQNGVGVPKDPSEALRWYRRSAEKGFSKALNAVGTFHELGLSLPADIDQALQWYGKAADAGSPAGMGNLGRMYLAGLGVERNPTEAVRWFRAAAELGDAGAQYLLANQYRLGEGIEVDYAQAARLYFLAARTGHPLATDVIIMSREVCKADAPLAGRAEYCFIAAESGDAAAQYAIGTLYERGIVVQSDKAAAVSWYRRAAEQGHTLSQMMLVRAYDKGEGVPSDIIEALAWAFVVSKTDTGGSYREVAKSLTKVLSERLESSDIREAELRGDAYVKEFGFIGIAREKNG